MRPIMLTVVAALVALLGLLLLALELVSPGRPVPFLDAAGNPLRGSLSEKIIVEINGTRQGMFIKSKNVTKPVLLYVHGGMPDYFMTQEHPTGLDDLFTVVWWEQRGAGSLTLPSFDVVHSHSVTRLSLPGPRASLLRTSSG